MEHTGLGSHKLGNGAHSWPFPSCGGWATHLWTQEGRRRNEWLRLSATYMCRSPMPEPDAGATRKTRAAVTADDETGGDCRSRRRTRCSRTSSRRCRRVVDATTAVQRLRHRPRKTPHQVVPFSWRKGGPYQVAQPPKSGPYQLSHDNGRSTIQVSERVGTQIAMISTRSPKAAKSPGFRV